MKLFFTEPPRTRWDNMLKKISIKWLPCFEKDFKKLLKRFRTLKEDLETFIKYQLKPFHLLDQDNQGIKQISDLGIAEPKIYKVRKFASKSLKGKGVQSGIRVIYAYFEDKNKIELIEIYYKSDKELEDKNRIKELYL